MTASAPTATSAQKALALLEVLAGAAGPLGVSELGRLVGASRGTVHKQLGGLVAAGWVEQADDGRYGLSLTAARVGNAALRQAGLGRRIQVVLEEVAARTGEAISIAALHRDATLIVQRAESDQVLHADIRVGTRIPLDEGASSHVLTAFALTSAKRGEMRASGIRLLPEDALVEIAADGVARTVDGFVEGITAISIPLYDALQFKTVALTLAAPNARVHFARHEAALREGRDEIYALMGESGTRPD